MFIFKIEYAVSQKTIGQVDLKTNPVYFYVQKNTPFNTRNVPIPFEVSKLNIGNAMSLPGTFTAPKAGTYTFIFTGFAIIQESTDKQFLAVDLMWKDSVTGTSSAIGRTEAEGTPSALLWEPFTIQATLALGAGDQIWLQIPTMTDGSGLFDDQFHHNHFIGWLQDENISSWLNSETK